MKQQHFNLVLLLSIVLSSVMAFGQGAVGPTPKKARTLDDYKPRAMKDVSARVPEEKARPDEQEKLIVQGDILPSRVRVTYAGRARPLPQMKKNVLYRWAQLYAGAPEHYTQPYETELLFREGKRDYWVGIRKQAMTQFENEVKKGKPVDLYLIRLGWARTGNEWEPLLLIENFQVPK